MPVVTSPIPKVSLGALRAMGNLAGTLFPRCANPGCVTGWMHLWRSRQVPIFEGKWTCSAECMEALVAAAVRREMDGIAAARPLRPHRVPMGLMLVRQGTITAGQLHRALDEQRRAGGEAGEARKLGEWLIESGVLSEPALTRVLSLQWNCPVFSLDAFQPVEMGPVLPRFLADTCGALPLRSRGGKVLYLAFAGRIDRSLSYAVERMTGLQVAAGILQDSEFRQACERYSATVAPSAQYLEAASSWALVRTIVRRIETGRAAESRLVRVHDTFWLRVWRRAQTEPAWPPPAGVEDLLATVGGAASSKDHISDWREMPGRR